MLLEKPKLFRTYKEAFWVLGVLSLILSVRLLLLYWEYNEFIGKPFYYTHALVLQQYTKQKDNKPYQVLKLRTKEGYTLYTTAHLKENLTNYKIRIRLIPDTSLGFWEYLRAFYIKSTIKEVYQKVETTKGKLLETLASQHQEREVISFYQAIFLATPLDKALREKIAMLGVSHLVALSGFHLSILWVVVYGLLLLLYQPLQQRYFPYRYSLIDLGILTIILLFGYLWFVEFPPSLLRSFAMLLIAWMALLLGIELVSFGLLGFIVIVLLALFPRLIVSLGFWFSVSGVFYIYLILHWSKRVHKYIISFIFIPLGIFILMQPIVHALFGITTLWQLLSPPLSLLFTLFYPLVIALHLISMGGVMDSWLVWLFSLPKGYEENILSLELLIGYIILSLGAIGSRWLFIATLLLSFTYLLYILV